MNPISLDRVVHKLLKVNEFIYDVVNVECIAKEVTQILLRPSNDFHLFYQAGQYVKVIHSNGQISPLSIANAPEKNGLIELHLAHPSDNLPAHDILRMISEEKKITLRGPYGSCTAKKMYEKPCVIFLARGTGFASVKAMIEEKIKMDSLNPADRQLHFYWSVTTPQEFYRHELITQWTNDIKNFSFTPVLSRPYPAWQGKVGWLQDIVLHDYPDLTNYRILISAPPQMVHAVQRALESHGLSTMDYCSDILDYDPSE